LSRQFDEGMVLGQLRVRTHTGTIRLEMGILQEAVNEAEQASTGPEGCRSVKDTLGQFALVSYIPDPLAAFLDSLRIELTPWAKPRAHVTILPPRPHDEDLGDTIERLQVTSKPFHSFHVEVGKIEIFAASHVVYLGFAHGADKLCTLYRALNCGSLQYAENFPYHPHVTIAQNIEAESAPDLAALAVDRWSEYQGPRGFTVDRLSFVQHIAPSVWVDVATLTLSSK
jgi:2'-5' RNA ligase